jgi:stage V sporulation protein B
MVLDLRHWVVLPTAVMVFLLFSGKYIYNFFDFLKLSSQLQTFFAGGTYVVIALFLMALVGVIDWREILQLLGIKNKRMRKFQKDK